MALSDRLEKIQTEKARVAGVKPSAAPEKRRKIVSTGSGS